LFDNCHGRAMILPTRLLKQGAERRRMPQHRMVGQRHLMEKPPSDSSYSEQECYLKNWQSYTVKAD